ncbi:MAG: NnrS family protein [Akkermansiaceae bacterium]
MKSGAEQPIIAAEPYRVFFPVALAAGVLGVLLWPAFYSGVLPYYPVFAHARVMIEGFVGGFAVGFLGTALPKMLSTPPLRLWQVCLLLALHIGYCTAHLFGYLRTGDGIFAGMMILMIALLLVRVLCRKSLPPAGMALTGLGLFSGVFGAAWGAVFGFQGDAFWGHFAQRLLYQAFIVLPLLGVGSFIFPMILGSQSKSAGLFGKAWRNKALEALLLGALVIATYWIEVHGQAKAMSWVRAVLCFVWLTKESGWLAKPQSRGVMPWALRAGIVCLLGGMVATGILQEQKTALEHSLYIGGFGLITMMVATRVIYGHSGQGHQFQKWIKPITVLTGLLLFGMATRISADFLPRVRISHHVYAAILWVVVCIIWGIAVIPSVRKRAFPSKPKSRPSPKSLPAKPSLMDLDFRK